MERLKHLQHQDDRDEFLMVKDPKALAVELIVDKNTWLTKMRWIYSLFILLFFSAYNALSGVTAVKLRELGFVIGLSALGNVLFILALKRGMRFPSEKDDYRLYTKMVALQLDFDLVVLSLLVYFSGGFESPVRALFIFYIVIGTFLIHYRKAIRNTITASLLVAVLFLTKEGLIITSSRLTTLTAFIILLLFAFIISAYLSRNIRANEEKISSLLEHTRELSVTDGLTNLYNQTHFFLLLRLQMEKAKRYHTPFSVIMFDVDNFKNYNDHNGHLKGSEALQQVAESMRTVFRSSDVLAKYGGDEFCVVLPNSDKVGAFLAADRLREVVEEEPFDGEDHQPLGRITLSLGVSSYPEHGRTIEAILDCADKALYFAKESGRNKTFIYSEDLDENGENE
jgi:diguanylate cyclase (GGDEF)-like protein